MQDNYLTDEEARAKILTGVNKVADIVALTLGAAGASIAIESEMNPGHRVVDDGVSVAQAIKLSDPYENIGANIIKEIALHADKESGDGTTTATVIARAILNSATEGNPQEIRNSLNKCLPIIFDSLEAQKKEITPDNVKQVAETSSNDPELADTLQEIYKIVGKDGIVELDNSGLPETFYDIVEGVRFRGSGYFGAYSTTEVGKAVYKNPHILISKEKIVSTDQIQPIFEALASRGINSLVLYVDEIDMSVASRLALTHLQGGFKTLIIKAPTLFKDWYFDDMAKITGATPIDKAEGVTFKSFNMNHLGTCDNIITTVDETRVIGIKDITEHIVNLKELVKEDENVNMRLSWLQTKAAILKMGANSESELSGKRAKAIDAISACHHALQEGTVVGGGIALYEIELPDTIGGKILNEALKAPMKQLLSNEGRKENYTRKEMEEKGVIDPLTVVKNSVTSAISTAGTILTTRGIIVLPKKHETTPNMPQLS